MRRVPMLPEWFAALTCIANLANLSAPRCLIRRPFTEGLLHLCGLEDLAELRLELELTRH